MAFRFLHTADWQIGKPFGGFEAEKRGVMREARIETVVRIAALAESRRCEVVLVAGDAFDDNTVADRDVRRTLDAMAGFSGHWIMLPGNHDALASVSVWSRLVRLGAGERVRVADRAEPILVGDGRAAILPAPLKRRFEAADLTAWFDAAETPAGAVRVGLAHGAVANRLPAAADGNNPIADDRAERARLDYLALGDWHGFVEIAPRTVYSGTPEPDRYPANAPGHVALVEIDAPGLAPRIERVPVARFDWRIVRAELFGDAGDVDAALAAVAEPNRAIVQLVLTGALPLRERARLDGILASWEARLFDLRVEDGNLQDEPDAEDLDAIEMGGFVRTAVDRLRAQALDPADPERETAALALRMLYVEHRRAKAGD